MALDRYKTVRKEVSVEFTEKKSVFIGYIKPIVTEEQAWDFIKKIGGDNADATHNVFAYINKEGNAARYSDAGEPQGTAGLPVFEILKREELYGVCVVVTRYFGGILLGAGGLVRAYGKACSLALEKAGTCIYRTHLVMKLDADYSYAGKLGYELPRRGAADISSSFSDRITYTFRCLPENRQRIDAFLSDVSRGQLSAEVIGEEYAPETP